MVLMQGLILSVLLGLVPIPVLVPSTTAPNQEPSLKLKNKPHTFIHKHCKLDPLVENDLYKSSRVYCVFIHTLFLSK